MLEKEDKQYEIVIVYFSRQTRRFPKRFQLQVPPFCNQKDKMKQNLASGWRDILRWSDNRNKINLKTLNFTQ